MSGNERMCPPGEVCGIPTGRLSLALLIDCEIIPATSVRDILSMTNVLGECNTRQLYADFNITYCARWKFEAAYLGLDVVPTPRIAHGKNSSDISLTVGAMDLAYSGEYELAEYEKYILMKQKTIVHFSRTDSL